MIYAYQLEVCGSCFAFKAEMDVIENEKGKKQFIAFMTKGVVYLGQSNGCPSDSVTQCKNNRFGLMCTF